MQCTFKFETSKTRLKIIENHYFMATAQVTQTKIEATLNIKKDKVTKETLIAKVGNLGSPINGKQIGDEFEVTLNGDIQIRSYGKQLGAYHMTKEGYSIRVNAAFNEKDYAEGTKHNCICLEWVNEAAGTKGKYCAFKTA